MPKNQGGKGVHLPKEEQPAPVLFPLVERYPSLHQNSKKDLEVELHNNVCSEDYIVPLDEARDSVKKVLWCGILTLRKMFFRELMFYLGAKSLLLDNNNNRTQMGEVNMMVNKHLEGQELVEVDRVNGFIRTYASRSPLNEQVTVFLLNKNDERENGVEVVINNFDEIKSYKRWEFKGKSWNDYNPVYSENGSIQFSGNSFTTSLEPLSVTVITISN